MIRIEVNKYDRHKFCLNCNCERADTKELKFSVGDNDYNACVIALCKECRVKLRSLLESEE